MAEKTFKIERVKELPLVGTNGYWYILQKPNGRHEIYIADARGNLVFNKGITDEEQSKLTGLKTQAQITEDINTMGQLSSAQFIPVLGTVLPQAGGIPDYITNIGKAELGGGVGGTTYTQTGAPSISVAEGYMRYGYYSVAENIWTASEQIKLPDEPTAWTSKSYPTGFRVKHMGNIWISSSLTTASDVPGQSNVWQAELDAWKSKYLIRSSVTTPLVMATSLNNLKNTIKSITLNGDWYSRLLTINSFSYNTSTNTLSVYISESSSEVEVINPSNPKIRLLGTKVFTPDELTKDVVIQLTPVDGTIYGSMTVNLSTWVLSDTNIANSVGGYTYKQREIIKDNVIDGNTLLGRNQPANLWSDPYFMDMYKWGHVYGDIYQYNNTFNGTLLNTGTGNKIYINSTSASANTSIRIPISKLGLKVSDTISATATVQSPDASRGRIFIAFYDSSGAQIGSTIYSNHPADISTDTIVFASSLIPANTIYLSVSFERTVGLGMVYFDKLVINKGYQIGVVGKNDKIRIKPQVDEVQYINDIDILMSTNTTISNFSSLDGVGGLYDDVKLSNIPCYGTKITGAKTAQMRFDYASKTFTAGHTVGMLIYVKNATHINDVNLEIYSNGTSEIWNRSVSNTGFGNPLVEGWNVVRLNITDSTLTNFGVDSQRIRMVIYTNDSCEVYLGAVFLEKSEKAKLLFVNDHGRKDGWINLQPGQTTTGVQDAEARGMPIIFALNPGHVENNDPLRMNLAELKTLSASPIARWSFHSYNTPVTATMSLEGLKLDIQRSLDWLMANGFGKPSFRGAITQNEAVNGRQTLFYQGLKALPSSTGSSASQPLAYPFTNRNNIARLGIHGRTTSFIDARFDLLKKTKGALIGYTHGIGLVGDSTSATVAEWNYYLSKVDEGVSEGWLSLVGYEELEQSLNLLNILDDDKSIKDSIIRRITYQLTV